MPVPYTNTIFCIFVKKLNLTLTQFHHKIPGKILSPFLVHSTFTVRLQMVNYSGYD